MAHLMNHPKPGTSELIQRNKEDKKEEEELHLPNISSFLLPSGDIRNHWIEHSEISIALSVRGIILKYEPKASEPSN